MDDLLDDPSNPNADKPPPPFGTNFNPHHVPTPPDLSNNPNTVDPVQSWVAQHQARDEHGRFVKFEHLNDSYPTTHNEPDVYHAQSCQAVPSSQTIPNQQSQPSSVLPPIIEINQNTKPTDKEDPPLFGFFLTNPVTYLKKFLTKLLKRQMIGINGLRKMKKKKNCCSRKISINCKKM
ncbi:hypothetical protein HYU93_05025 [Candidatus Daviesbacteria bacterium]|nr:hypothetical protein [Candidatus Daviesbacteria bacterium]